MRLSSSRTELFVESYAAASRGTDLFHGRKEELNTAFLRALPLVVWRLADRVEGLRVLAQANSVDIDNPWYRMSGDPLEDGRPRLFGWETVKSLVETASSIALVLDNAGEAVYDLAYALLQARRGARVLVAARGKPYEVDVTAAEVRRLLRLVAGVVGVDPAGVEVVGTGSSYPPTAVEDVARLLEGFDVVLVKGIANLEAFIEYGLLSPLRTVLLFRAKCLPLARLFEVRLGEPVIAHGVEVAERWRSSVY